MVLPNFSDRFGEYLALCNLISPWCIAHVANFMLERCIDANSGAKHFFKIWLPNNTFDDDKRNLRSTPSKLPLTPFFTIRFFEIDALNSFMNKKRYLTTKNGAWNKGGTFSYHIWNIIIMLITWNSNLHTFFKLIGTDRHLPWNVISVWCFDQTLCLVNCYEK